MVTRVHTELARSRISVGSNSASHTIKVTEANSGVVVFFTGTRGHVGGCQTHFGQLDRNGNDCWSSRTFRRGWTLCGG